MGTNTITDWGPVIRAKEKCSRKIIQRTAAAILKKAGMTDTIPKHKFSFKSKNDLLDLYTLSAYLFVFGEYELCFDVCTICDHIVFNGNYDLWNIIEHLRAMEIYILKRNGKEIEAEQIIDLLREHEAPIENYERHWSWVYNRATSEFPRMYSEAKEGKRTPSSVRYLIMGTAMTCIQYIQMGYLSEKHVEMQEWTDKIIDFLQREEE